MINKALKILFIFFFWLTLMIFETSFLSIFTDFSLIIFLIIVINLIENPESNFGLLSAFLGGLFLDLNSSQSFGFFTFGAIIFSLTIKFILSKFLRIPYVSWLPKI